MIGIGGLLPLQPDHGWRECRPVLVGDDYVALSADDLDRIGELIMLVWNSLPPEDREAFHRCSCLGSTAGDDLIAVGAVFAAMQGVIDIDIEIQEKLRRGGPSGSN